MGIPWGFASWFELTFSGETLHGYLSTLSIQTKSSQLFLKNKSGRVSKIGRVLGAQIWRKIQETWPSVGQIIWVFQFQPGLLESWWPLLWHLAVAGKPQWKSLTKESTSHCVDAKSISYMYKFVQVWFAKPPQAYSPGDIGTDIDIPILYVYTYMYVYIYIILIWIGDDR